MFESVEKIIGAAIGLVAAGIAWLIRRVVTNSTQIDLLEREIRKREELRMEDRQYLRDMKESIDRTRQEDRQVTAALVQDIREIRADVKELFRATASK